MKPKFNLKLFYSYRSSLLFQACLSAALCNREVIFICKDQFQCLPLFVHNMPKPDENLLKLIKFKQLLNEGKVKYSVKIYIFLLDISNQAVS